MHFYLFFTTKKYLKTIIWKGHFTMVNTLNGKSMSMKYLFLSIAFIFSSLSFSQSVIINAQELATEQIEEIYQIYGIRPKAGSYWYDTRSGAYGIKGGPVIGVMYPGHQFGHLSPSASHGTSGVFINNRQLQSNEAIQLANLFGYYKPVPGRYWMNSNGDIGVEGYGYAIGNIYMAIAIAQRTRANWSTQSGNLWSSGLSSGGNYYTGANGQPSQGYVSVPGYGPVSHGMN